MPDESTDAPMIPGGRGGMIRPWRPGQSGNPRGIPEHAREVTRLAKESSPAVMKRLIEIALDRTEDSRASIVAASHILDRAFGKAKEGHQVPDEPVAFDLSHLSEPEVLELQAAMETMRRLTGREMGPIPVVRVYLPDNGRTPQAATEQAPRYDASGRKIE